MDREKTSVHKVKVERDLNDFLRLPWKIYKGDPYWIPPLLKEMKFKLNRLKRPFFEHPSPVNYFTGEKIIFKEELL